MSKLLIIHDESESLAEFMRRHWAKNLSNIGPRDKAFGCAACDRGDYQLGHSIFCPKVDNWMEMIERDFGNHKSNNRSSFHTFTVIKNDERFSLTRIECFDGRWWTLDGFPSDYFNSHLMNPRYFWQDRPEGRIYNWWEFKQWGNVKPTPPKLGIDFYDWSVSLHGTTFPFNAGRIK
jgi:hypothetical protein